MSQLFSRTGTSVRQALPAALALVLLPAAALAQGLAPGGVLGEVPDSALPPLEDVLPISRIEALVPPLPESEGPSTTGSIGEEGDARDRPAPAPESSAPAVQVAVADAENARTYCANIADAAADARFARQAQALADMEKAIEERIGQLEEKRAEYEEWLKRREDFLRQVDSGVVAIFTQMRPDAASQQLMAMSLEAAAAILVKLKPRTASAILNEMDPTKAAMLTTTMAGMADPSDEEQTPG